MQALFSTGPNKTLELILIKNKCSCKLRPNFGLELSGGESFCICTHSAKKLIIFLAPYICHKLKNFTQFQQKIILLVCISSNRQI